MKPYETLEHNGFTIKLYQDSDAEAPDNEENDIFIVTTRNQYFELRRDSFDIDSLKQHKKCYHILPLYAYVHSGVALSLGRGGQFSDPWDSGQIGFVLVQKGVGFRNIQKAAECYVERWNQYLSGDIWGYVIEDSNGEHIDSCWGFYGLDDVRNQALEACPKPSAEEGIKVLTRQAGDEPL